MKIESIEVGRTYTYHPPQDATDNLHFPATVVRKGKRVTIDVANSGRLLAVSPKRLTDQGDLLADLP